MTDQNLVLSTGGLAIGTVYLIELAKRSKLFPFLTADTETANRIVGVLAALIGAMGIHYEWDAASRVLAFTIPTASAALHGGWQFFIQWAIQQYVYKTGVSPVWSGAVERRRPAQEP